MMNIVFGALGVLLVLGLLALGFFCGWRARICWVSHTQRAAIQEISEQERKELLAQQKAFDQMMSYNADVAYGTARTLDDIIGGGDEA